MRESIGSDNKYLALETGAGLFAIPICQTKGVVIGTQGMRPHALPRMPDYVMCLATSFHSPHSVSMSACADSVETTAVHSLMGEKLHRCLKLLSDDENSLIRRRYWDQASQSEVAAELKTSQQVISYREKQILGKLKKLLEK